MKATLLLVLFAWIASGTFALPVQHAGQTTLTSSRASTASNRVADEIRVPRFDLQRHETSGARAGSWTTSNWAERAGKALRRLRSFYRISYPSRSQKSSTTHSTIVVDMASERNSSRAFTTAPRRKNAAEQFLLQVSPKDLVIFCHEYSPEIIGIAIFLLVPAAVLVADGLDKLRECCTPERFPQRGRARVRLTGHERQLSVLAAWEREKVVKEQAEKWWRHRRRG